MKTVVLAMKNKKERQFHSENNHVESNEDIINRLDKGIQSPQEKVEGVIESPR